MKKRLLSLTLAVLMLAAAIPAVALPAMAADTTPPTYEAADYNALYIQNGFVFGFDFFTTNAIWGGEAYTSTDEAAAQAMLNTFVYKKAASSLSLALNDRARAETVAIADGALDTSGIYQLLVSNVDSAMGDAYNGSTVELTFIPRSSGGSSGQFPVLNDHRFSGKFEGDSFVYTGISLQDTGLPMAVAPSYNSTPTALALDEVATYVYQMQRPENTQAYYQFSYTAEGVVRPSDVTGDLSNDFHVGFAATKEGDTVTAVTPLSTSSKYSFYLYRPTYVEFEGQKYIVGATLRSECLEGEGGPVYHDPATAPGMLGIYKNGETIYYDDAVRYPNNTKSSATYLRLWGNGPDTATYSGRFYGRVLTADELAVNHAVDLFKWFRLDITGYLSLGSADRATLAKAFAEYSFTSDRDAVAALLKNTYDSIAYDGLLDGLTVGTPAYEATAAFLTVAKQYQLSIAEVKLLPEVERLEIYTAVTAAAALPGVHTSASIQAALDEAFDAILARYIGEVPEYDYKDIYVRQDKLQVAIDFFDAKATDDPVYVGVSYDNWPALYDEYTANWQSLGYASKAEAEAAAYEDREENVRPNNWEAMLDQYLWKGTKKDITPLDIVTPFYRHDNIRRFGDGTFICSLNNSIVLTAKDDSTDLTYQAIGHLGGNWQVRGFRPSFTTTAGSLSLSGLSYNGLTVTGTPDAPKFNEAGLISFTIPRDERPTVAMGSSVDFTAVVDKTPGGDLPRYYKHEWDASQSKFVVTEVSDPAESTYGPVSYAGKMDLSFYGNSEKIFELNKHYSPGAPDSLGNTGANVYYAIRLYNCALTAEEIKQNHFADLAGLYDLDLAPYYRLSTAQRAELHQQLRNVELGTDRQTVEEYYHAVLADVYYTLATDTDAARTAVGLSKEYLLDITGLLALSPRSRERVYATLASDPLVVEGVEWHPAILQSKLNGLIKTVKQNYYAESVSHRVIELEGYQINLTGERPGMRAVFTMDDILLEEMRLAYRQEGITVTLGVMLLPATAENAEITVENGNVVLPAATLSSLIAHDGNGVTDAAVIGQEGTSYCLEYYPGEADVDTDVAFVGFTCIQVPGEDPIVNYTEYTSGNIASGNAFSLLDLSRYVKRTQGMAHKNIQAVLNAADGREDVSLRLGNSDLSDYVICKTAENHHLIDSVQEIINSYTGVRLQVVEDSEIAGYANIFYLGAMDTVYTESALYGIQAHGNSFGVWYNDRANAEAAIEKLEDIFELAAEADDLSYHVTAGTAYTYRAR